MGPHCGLSLRGGFDCPAPLWNVERGDRAHTVWQTTPNTSSTLADGAPTGTMITLSVGTVQQQKLAPELKTGVRFGRGLDICHSRCFLDE